MAYQKEKFASFLEHEMAEFFSREAAGLLPAGAFISVSRILPSDSGEEAVVYVLIFPESQAKESFREIKRMENEARKYISGHLKRRKAPKIIIKLDEGQGKKLKLEKLLDDIEEK